MEELLGQTHAAHLAEQEMPATDYTPLVCTALSQDDAHARLQEQLAEMAIADVQRAQKARRAGDPQMFEFDFVKPVEMGIELFAGGLRSLGVQQSYGPAILTFTLGLKALTFPLNKQQIESTTKMQAVAPAAKKLQERYRNKDPARLNLELQKLYQENEVNPLAGCLPAFAQIPIFILFYRARCASPRTTCCRSPSCGSPRSRARSRPPRKASAG
jgi:membrane protein insertase Oxa1/YidC/SpoIIIJ